MKLFLMPNEPTWWVWVLTEALLLAGLLGFPWGFAAAIVLSAAQAIVFLLKERSPREFTVQVRIAYTLLLIVCQLPYLSWLIWLPVIGTLAFVLFGYCLMARFLSLLPGNREEPLSIGLLRRTFFAPPVPGDVRHGMPRRVCHLEARAARFSQPTTHKQNT